MLRLGVALLGRGTRAACTSLLVTLFVVGASASSGCSGGGKEESGAAGQSPASGGAPIAGGGAPIAGGGTSAGSTPAPASGGSPSLGRGGRDATTGGAGASGMMVTGGAGRGSGGEPATTGGMAAGTTGAAGRANGGASGTMSSAGRAGAAGSGGGAAPVPGCGVSTDLKSGRASLDVSGSQREYILKLPDNYDANRSYKLIFGFHARGGNATQVAGGSNNDYYGLASRAAGSAVFVAPEGLDAGWRNTDGRDIEFVEAMIALFRSKLCIDEARLFSVGFSFGGMMSDAIGCAMADVFRAIAPMAGGIPNPDHPYSGCDERNMHPIAVWMAHGDNDTVVPLADGKDALELFLRRNQCQEQTSPVTPSPCVAYQGCLADYPIHFCQFSGGHSVPSFASQAIWDFFNQF